MKLFQNNGHWLDVLLASCLFVRMQSSGDIRLEAVPSSTGCCGCSRQIDRSCLDWCVGLTDSFCSQSLMHVCVVDEQGVIRSPVLAYQKNPKRSTTEDSDDAEHRIAASVTYRRAVRAICSVSNAASTDYPFICRVWPCLQRYHSRHWT